MDREGITIQMGERRRDERITKNIDDVVQDNLGQGESKEEGGSLLEIYGWKGVWRTLEIYCTGQ